MGKYKITPSVASANPLYLAEELSSFPGDMPLHVDIEDGSQAPNITFGMKTVNSVAALVNNPLDFHVLVTVPSVYYRDLARLNTRYVFIPFEVLISPMEDLDQIRMLGMKPALSVTMNTPIDTLEAFADEVEAILLLTYGSARGGTNGLGFRAHSYERIRRLRRLLSPDKEIFVDGGIGIEELELCLKNGADEAILGRLLFPENQDTASARILTPAEREKSPGRLLREIEEKLEKELQ